MNPHRSGNLSANTWCWISLILLSAGSLWANHSRAGVLALLGLAGAKAFLVGWQFMGLRESHPAWRWGMATLLGGSLGAILWLAR